MPRFHFRNSVLILLFLFAASGCSFPGLTILPSPAPTITLDDWAPPPALRTVIPSPPPPTLTPSPTLPPPTPTFTPSPTPLPLDLVWFTPNMGSTDFLALFSDPQQWSAARQKVDVFQFYSQNVFTDPCPICGGNTLQALIDVSAFQQLKDWGKAVAIEVGAVKEWGCDGIVEYRVAKSAIRSVQTNGGAVKLLSMDEPLLGGQLVANGITCGNTFEETVHGVAQFTRLVRSGYPNIIVGDIEPYPHYSVSQLEDWLLALEAAGVEPGFFHLDVDIERVRVEGQNVSAHLQELQRFCQEHQIPFGVIFTSNWTASGSDQGYYKSTLSWLNTVHAAIGKPQHVIFQSWQGPAPNGVHQVPINLPQNDPSVYSHTRLILEGLSVFGY